MGEEEQYRYIQAYALQCVFILATSVSVHSVLLYSQKT